MIKLFFEDGEESVGAQDDQPWDKKEQNMGQMLFSGFFMFKTLIRVILIMILIQNFDFVLYL